MSKKTVNNYPFHYLYKMSHPTGHYYYGIHSSFDPYVDKYRGSGRKLKEMYKQYPTAEWRKEIIQVFTRRIDVEDAEGKMVTHKMLADPLCINKCLGGVRKR